MTVRELLIDALSGKATPRVPVAPFIFNNIVSKYNGKDPQDPIAACVAFYKKFGFDIILRNYIISDYMDEERISCERWRVEKQTAERADGWDEKTVITTPERKMTQTMAFRRVSPFETVSAITEYYIKDAEDFEQFKKYQPPLGKCDCSRVAHARELVGEDGLTGPWVHGAFNLAGTYRELSQLLMDAYIDEDFYAQMLEYFCERCSGFMEQAIGAGADFISMSGNMASASMAGPEMFESRVMPYEKRVIDKIHKAGAKIIYHNCGDAKLLLPLYSKMGIDMYESLTAPPYGDTDLSYALETVRLPTALSGGIDQIEFLKTASPGQVRERVKQVLETVKPRGGFILAASDYLGEETPEENIMALAQAGREYGSY